MWVGAVKEAVEGLGLKDRKVGKTGKLGWKQRLPHWHSGTSPGGEISGCQEPEGRIPSHWKLYWKVREMVRNTITVAIGKQMPDATKSQLLNWGLAGWTSPLHSLGGFIKSWKIRHADAVTFCKVTQRLARPQRASCPSRPLPYSPHLPPLLPSMTGLHPFLLHPPVAGKRVTDREERQTDHRLVPTCRVPLDGA